MKKTKFFVLALALALLVCSVIGIAVSANEDAATPEIIGKNIRYGENLKFRIAVDGDSLGADKTVTVNFYDTIPADGVSPIDTATAVYTDTSDKTKYNLDVDSAYIAVSNYGISAIAYGQTFYITAECDGAVSEVLEYSAAEYFLERLYADADTITEIQKAHYENALAYGSTAQLVTGDEKTNVADYIFVGAKGGEVIVNGESVGESALLLAGDKFSLKPAGTIASGYAPLWKDALGNSIKGASEITATASGMYNYTLTRLLTFDGMENRALEVFANTNTTWTSQKYISIGEGYDNIFRAWNGSVGTKENPGAEIKDGKIWINSTDGSDYLEIHPTYTEADYNLCTFEADITFLSSGNFTTDLRTKTGSTAIRFQNFIYDMSNGYFKWNATNASGGTGNTIGIYLPTDGENAHTLNLKIEWYTDGTNILNTYYFNGDLVYIIASEAAPEGGASNWDGRNTDGVYLSGTRYYSYNVNNAGVEAPVTDFSAFHMLFNSSAKGSIGFDNVSFTQVKVTEKPDVNITKK